MNKFNSLIGGLLISWNSHILATEYEHIEYSEYIDLQQAKSFEDPAEQITYESDFVDDNGGIRKLLVLPTGYRYSNRDVIYLFHPNTVRPFPDTAPNVEANILVRKFSPQFVPIAEEWYNTIVTYAVQTGYFYNIRYSWYEGVLPLPGSNSVYRYKLYSEFDTLTRGSYTQTCIWYQEELPPYRTTRTQFGQNCYAYNS